MATNIKILSMGSTTSTTAANIYGPLSTGKSAIVTSVVLSNNSGSASLLATLWAKPSGTGMRIFRQSIVNTAANNTANITDLVSLASGEGLQASVDVGTLDYVVFGIERD